MGQYEDLLDEVKELDPDIAERLGAFKATALRDKAAKHDEVAAENERLKGELAKVQAAPKRQDALRKAGVALDELRPAERALIEQVTFEGDEPTEDEVSALIEKYQLPVHTVDEEGAPKAEGVVSAAMSAPTGKSAAVSTKVSAETVADWPMDKALRFQEQHPDEWEALKRGEEVNVAFA